MLPAVLDILRVTHERVQVDLVDNWKLVTPGDNLVDVLGAKVGHADRLDQALLLGVHQSAPELLAELDTARRRMEKVQVKVRQPSTL